MGNFSNWLTVTVMLLGCYASYQHGHKTGYRSGYSKGWDDGEGYMIKVAVERKVARWEVWSQKDPSKVLVWNTDKKWNVKVSPDGSWISHDIEP